MGIQLVCCWPGLAAAWYRGVVQSLMIAIFFCWAICVLLLATFLWPEWLNAWLVRGSWTAVLAIWLTSSVRNHWNLSKILGVSDQSVQEAFELAQEEYLKGDWFEAEAILLDILHDQPRDAEALLLLVGVLRHTKRWQPALRRLGQLELLENASIWRFEIAREKALIERSLAELKQPSSPESAIADQA